MSKNLLIVESPSKAKTIEKFLGSDFTVLSSYGHIRDLSKKEMGIDIENEFTPDYILSDDKKTVIKSLKAAVKGSTNVWLASDEDREGEAIAWHLAEVLGLSKEDSNRICFHEITKEAISKAIASPRKINIDLVNAQQARRILDRIVGFELSPLLWRKIKPQLSAGRVQSAILRLIVEREKEILAYKSESSYNLSAVFKTKKGESFASKYEGILKTKEEALNLLSLLKNATFFVKSLDVKDGVRSPVAPFITSTLQQEASRKMGYSVIQTMSIAQKLYENGHITYMRTDSTSLSSKAKEMITEEVIKKYGKEYLKIRDYKNKVKGAQEAHECIRPTNFAFKSIEGTTTEQKLYSLIWKRAVASQMSSAIVEKTTIKVTTENSQVKNFITIGEVIKFDGFLALYTESLDDSNEVISENNDDSLLPRVVVNESLDYSSILGKEKFSLHPPRYAEASLVKKMEDLGIGRPSTYASAVNTVVTRGYVIKEDRDPKIRNVFSLELKEGVIKEVILKENYDAERSKLFPTDIGIVVLDYLVDKFSNVMDYQFTAKVEEEFDIIAAGDLDWKEMLKSFYTPFHELVVINKEDTTFVKKDKILGIDKKTGLTVLVRIGKYGPLVQLGTLEELESQEGVKPKFAALKKGQLIDTITIDEAITLFDLPRVLGVYEEKTLSVALGRFGPYIRFGDIFISLEKQDDPYTIELDRAIVLIENKIKKIADNTVVSYTEESISILKGRFGYDLIQGKIKIKLGKNIKTEDFTLEKCKEIINLEVASKKKPSKAKVKSSEVKSKPSKVVKASKPKKQV